jgi:hypothetical protein
VFAAGGGEHNYQLLGSGSSGGTDDGSGSVWPSIFNGSGPWRCVGLDCLQSVTVTAWEVGPLGDTALPIDLASGLNLFRNVSTGSNFLITVLGNQILFTAPSSADYIRTGQLINSGVFVSNPGGSANNVRFDVSYNLADCAAPEPGTYAMVGFALAGLGLWKRRRLV